MAVGYSEALRNARLDAITAAVGGGGLLRIYGGTRPGTGGTPTTLLSELTCGTPFAPEASGGVLSPTLPADDEEANATGEATWWRLLSSSETFVADGDAGEVATELILDDASIVAGGTVSISSWSITAGNP